jgi:hypothetical protein
MATVTGDAELVRIGPGKLYAGPFSGTDAVVLPTTIAAAANDTTLTTTGKWREIGFTTEGSVTNYSATTDGVEVAERLRPIKFTTMAQFSPTNLALATNSDPATAITTTATETIFVWPKAGGVVRASLLWVADDGLEALVIVKAFAGGSISVPRRKGVEPASVGVTFSIEENSTVTVTIDGDDVLPDAYNIWDESLVA